MHTTLPLTIHSAVSLNNGVEMPRLGLGVYQSEPGKETRRAVRDALDVGYRHIDTARAYDNERDVGGALRESGVPRGDVFVTTKLWNDDQGYDSALRAFDASLHDLGLEYVDLYIIHFPVPETRRDSWRALEAIARSGRARAIGVSNYQIHHLDELLATSDTVPAVNQVEFHPFLHQRDLLDFCRARGIQLEAYSPLARAERLNDLVIAEIARRRGKTPAQILIRWSLQHDLVVIPKSVHRKRIAENAAVFDFSLTEAEMAALDGLDEGLRTNWDPSDVP